MQYPVFDFYQKNTSTPFLLWIQDKKAKQSAWSCQGYKKRIRKIFVAYCLLKWNQISV